MHTIAVLAWPLQSSSTHPLSPKCFPQIPMTSLANACGQMQPTLLSVADSVSVPGKYVAPTAKMPTEESSCTTHTLHGNDPMRDLVCLLCRGCASVIQSPHPCTAQTQRVTFRAFSAFCVALCAFVIRSSHSQTYSTRRFTVRNLSAEDIMQISGLSPHDQSSVK